MCSSDYRDILAYLIIAIGFLFAVLAAVVPYYNVGHLLLFSVVLANTAPYFIYGIAYYLFRSWWTVLFGILLVVSHGSLVINLRYIIGYPYDDQTIYSVPLYLAIVIIVMSILAGALTAKK